MLHKKILHTAPFCFSPSFSFYNREIMALQFIQPTTALQGYLDPQRPHIVSIGVEKKTFREQKI